MWQKYNLDSEMAKKCYTDEVRCKEDFVAYSPAYLKSNESVSEIMNCLRPQGKTALSVMGSGDIPLCLSAYGAKYVDTFDISINAYLVLRLKMHMLQKNVDKEHYDNVLNDLSGEHKFTETEAWESVYDAFKDDKDIMKYLYDMDGCTIWGMVPSNPYWKMENFQYDAIKYSLPKSYNFIWTDLYNLPTKIHGKKYDIIYLSNILQYAKCGDDILRVVNSLQPHLNNKGTIVLDSLTPIYENEYEFLNKKLNWAKTVYSEAAGTVFLKTR